MPNCFTLTKKGENKPTKLSVIDEELCKLLDLPVHPICYVLGWFDSVGFSLACGKTFDQIEETLKKRMAEDEAKGKTHYLKNDVRMLKVIDYLRTNYTKCLV